MTLLHDEIYTPDVISNGLLHIISNTTNITSIKNVCDVILTHINEFKSLLFSKTGIFLTHRIFVPYDCIDLLLLEKIKTNIKQATQFNGMQNNSINETVYSTDINSKHTNETMGASLVLCGFLLVLHKIFKTQTVCINSVFDAILQHVLNNCNVNKVQLLKDCIKYGYTVI